MGRKGIGKLSLFSIANVVEIKTAKGPERNAFRMRLDEIRSKVQQQGGRGTYYPTSTGADRIDFNRGTRISLTELRDRQTSGTSKALRKRIARRFTVLGGTADFKVFVDGHEVVPADRDYYDKLQYVWTYGVDEKIKQLAAKAKFIEPRAPGTIEESLQISGWLGAIKESRQLKDEEGDNLNRIAIFIRGKMAQEDILADFSERGVYASYIIRELRADGFDLYDGTGTKCDEDSATSSHQKLVEDDELYLQLKHFLARELEVHPDKMV